VTTRAWSFLCGYLRANWHALMTDHELCFDHDSGHRMTEIACWDCSAVFWQKAAQ